MHVSLRTGRLLTQDTAASSPQGRVTRAWIRLELAETKRVNLRDFVGAKERDGTR